MRFWPINKLDDKAPNICLISISLRKDLSLRYLLDIILEGILSLSWSFTLILACYSSSVEVLSEPLCKKLCFSPASELVFFLFRVDLEWVFKSQLLTILICTLDWSTIVQWQPSFTQSKHLWCCITQVEASNLTPEKFLSDISNGDLV